MVGRGLGQEAFLVRKEVGLSQEPCRLSSKGQASGDSDIVEEPDKLVPNGEGDSTAKDL